MKEKVVKLQSERGMLLDPIPLRVVLPHLDTVYANHHQNLSTIEKRGGLSPREMLHVLLDTRWGYGHESRRIQALTQVEADLEIRVIVRMEYPRMVAEERAALGREKGCTHDVPAPEKVLTAVGAHKCPKCGVLEFEYQ